jgi:hypothetical protein
VRIDYPEPADEPSIPRNSDCALSPDDSRLRVIARPPSDPAEWEAVHRDYHALVQCSDGGNSGGGESGSREQAATESGSWEEGAAGFRAEWSEYEGRHPQQERPVPQSPPDGSWSCGDARKLTPDQNAEVSSGYARIREIGERDVVPGILAVEAADSSRVLAGFEHHIKGEDRLKEKVAELLEPPSEVTASQALAAVADPVRFTFDYPEATYTEGVHADVKRLKGLGFELGKLKNSWDSDQYKGVNSQWREPASAVRFEVQFHTQASHEAKELSHEAYERLRSGYARDDEREELKAFQSRVNAKVPIPPGVDTIENFPGEKRNG